MSYSNAFFTNTMAIKHNQDGKLTLKHMYMNTLWKSLVENEAHFVLEYPLYKSMRDRLASLFENGIVQSLKPFFHQVDIHLYLIEATALRHSNELVGLKFEPHFDG